MGDVEDDLIVLVPYGATYTAIQDAFGSATDKALANSAASYVRFERVEYSSALMAER